jgi:hypothetical protein
MIKAAGFVSATLAPQPAYNSSPITRGAMFYALKPMAGAAADPLSDDDRSLIEGGGCAPPEARPGAPSRLLAKLARWFAAIIGWIRPA